MMKPDREIIMLWHLNVLACYIIEKHRSSPGLMQDSFPARLFFNFHSEASNWRWLERKISTPQRRPDAMLHNSEH
jgi:hypothetical protein